MFMNKPPLDNIPTASESLQQLYSTPNQSTLYRALASEVSFSAEIGTANEDYFPTLEIHKTTDGNIF